MDESELKVVLMCECARLFVCLFVCLFVLFVCLFPTWPCIIIVIGNYSVVHVRVLLSQCAARLERSHGVYMSLFCMQTTCALEGCGQAGLLTADLARLQYHGTNALLLLHDSSSNCDGIFTPQHCGTGFAYSVHVHVVFSMHAITISGSRVV